VVEFHHSGPGAGCVQQVGAGEWGDGSDDESDADVGLERAGREHEYCYDTTNDNACSAWTSAGASTSVGLSGLSYATTYYWQVRR